jgi:hypothetical protein
MIITSLSTSIFWLALWALREYERRRRFESLSEEIETLRASDRRLREENQALRDREQSHLQMIAFARDRAREIRDGFDLGEKALLAASAEPTGQGCSQGVTA